MFRQQIHKHCKTESLEITTFMEADATQQSSKKNKGQNKKLEIKKKPKDEGECSRKKSQSVKKLTRKKESNDRVMPSVTPPTPRETASEYNNVKGKKLLEHHWPRTQLS